MKYQHSILDCVPLRESLVAEKLAAITELLFLYCPAFGSPWTVTMGKKKKKKRDTGARAATRDVRSVDVNIEGLHAYQYCLSREEQKKLEVTEAKMTKDLDGRLIYWVKDLNREDDDLDYVEPFPVVLKRNMRVKEIEDLVLKGHSEAGVDWPELPARFWAPEGRERTGA